MVISVVCRRWGVREAEQVAGESLVYVPRVAVGRGGVVWLDGRGQDAVRIAGAVRERWSEDEEVGCGVARTPIAAYAAAIDRTEGAGLVVVEAGTDRAFLADRPLGVLELDDRLLSLLEGVGIETCGQLAEVSREAVEVRFGADVVGAWRLSRAEDERILFRSPSADLPQATLDFIDYVVTDPEQLAFTANRLLGGVCDALQARGAHARRIELLLPLANGETWRKVLRPARPTASRTVWLRLVRRVLERLTVPDAVSGIEVRVLDAEVASAIQGDLFDAGFATAGAVESALARLLEAQGPVVVRPDTTAHPLPERRTEFVPLDSEAVTDWSSAPAVGVVQGGAVMGGGASGLTLQLLREPRPIPVEEVERRDHRVPVRYRDRDWKRFLTVAGPERVSGGQWDEPYAREYYRGVTAEGGLIWIFRDAREGRWYLHGWWD